MATTNESFREKIQKYLSDIDNIDTLKNREMLNSTIRLERFKLPSKFVAKSDWWEDVLYFNVVEQNIEICQYETLVNKDILVLHIVYNDYTVNYKTLDSNEYEHLRVEELRQEIERTKYSVYEPAFK